MAGLSGEALDALAQAISERLQAAVPEGVSPSIPADVRMVLETVVNQAGTFEENLLVASESILSGVQDQIIRDLKEGWPRSVDGTPGGRDSGKDLPAEEAAVVRGTLRLWYGDARRPALELPPIRLDGLQTDVQ